MDASGNPVASVVFGANGLVAHGGNLYQFDPQGNTVHVLDELGEPIPMWSFVLHDAWGEQLFGFNPTPSGYKGQWGYCTNLEPG
ncbi:MAG: hypothetical protein RMM06_10330, partial [Armatimonadota bacterium]|nr:hypothetical protein [Armatimonadota bacterium]